MKTSINAIIVVEGKSDIAFLSSFIDAEFVSTNGSDVPDGTIDYLLNQSSGKEIIVLTDPDAPGEKIRHKLDSHIAGLKHCRVFKKDAIKKGKVGIAETTVEAVIEALKFPISKKRDSEGLLKPSDLFRLGLAGSDDSTHRREFVSMRYHLGYVNGKQLLKRINSLNITYQQLEATLREIH
ncbi:MAG: ribonuclease M5 [Bacteroidia bacterium]|nr:ribonuclease M5 [Bacteroidia bacterium]